MIATRRGPATRSLPSWLLVVGGVAVALVLWRYAREYSRTDGWYMIDLDVYRWGGQMARTSDRLYTARYGDFLLFTYTPFAAAVFMPMSLLAWGALKAVMTVLSLVALLVTVGVSLRSLGYRLDAGWAGATLALAAIGATLEPVHETLLFGQVNLILMAIVVTDLCLPDTNRFKGIGVGIAAGFKLTPAIFIPYLLLTRRWASAARAVGAAAATVVIGFVALPSESTDFWFDRLFIDSERVGGVAYVANQSLSGALIRFTGSVGAAGPYWWVAAAVVAVGGLWLAASVSRRGAELAGIVLCALTGLLVSPVSWSHHWVWAVPALVLAVDAALRRTPWAWLGAGAIVVLFSSFLWEPGIIWQAPHKELLEYTWTLGQTVQGDLYVLVGLVALAVGGWLAWRLPATARPAESTTGDDGPGAPGAPGAPGDDVPATDVWTTDASATDPSPHR